MIYKIDNFFTTEYVEDFLLLQSNMKEHEMVSAISACADTLESDRGLVVDLENGILLEYLTARGCEDVKPVYGEKAKKTYVMGCWGNKVTRKYHALIPGEILVQVDLYGLVHGNG